MKFLQSAKARLITLLATLALLVTLAPVQMVGAACNNGTITFYDGASGSGAKTNALCADYGYAWSFDQGAIRFTDGTNVDNRISSFRLSSTVPDSFDFRGYTGYYFVGTTWTVSPNGATLVNLPSTMNNQMSSWKNLGQ